MGPSASPDAVVNVLTLSPARQQSIKTGMAHLAVEAMIGRGTLPQQAKRSRSLEQEARKALIKPLRS